MTRQSENRPEEPRESSKERDYHIYRLGAAERLLYGSLYAGLDLLVSYLFFSSLTVFLLFLPGVWLFWKYQAKALQHRREDEMREAFMTGMQFVSTALGAGYAIENAFREGCLALERLNGTGHVMSREFRWICRQMELNQPVEKVMMDLGARSGVEEIRSFAEIFLAARKTGADLTVIVRNTAESIRQKNETRREIDTLLAGRKMEQRLMSAIPLLILLYIRTASPSFLAPLYHNLPGAAVMTVCLAVYAAAVLWAGKIMDIRI